MSPRAHALLLGAYRRYRGYEDPLTELLATTLEAYAPFARALFAHAGLAVPHHVEAFTQLRTDTGRRVDLAVHGRDADGALRGVLWSENKVDAAYQPDQLGSYQVSLAALGHPGRLITIVNHVADARVQADPLGVPVLTWHAVAWLAWRAGKEHEQNARWRTAARTPSASAGLRLLEEFVSYLEEDQNVMIDPVNFEHVRAFQLANTASDALTSLLRRATQLAAPELSAYKDVGYDLSDDWGSYWQIFEGGPAWLLALEGYREIGFSDSDSWTEDRVDQPAIGAGATLPEDHYERLRGAAAWKQELAAHGFELGLWRHSARVFRTVYLAEITAKGPTLETQAQWLAAWLRDTMARLDRVPAPPG